MKIKIFVTNDPYLKLSTFAFGTLFTNLNEYTINEDDVEKTFENIGVYKSKIYPDITGVEYKVVGFSLLNKYENPSEEKVYRVDVRRLDT